MTKPLTEGVRGEREQKDGEDQKDGEAIERT
jgi:hypothetical protein